MKIGNQWLGGVLDETHQHLGSAGILIFLRWFLWKNIEPIVATAQYDTFIITRSDYYYKMPHISIQELYKRGGGDGDGGDAIYVPNSEYYFGITDRHTIIPRQHLKTYCNILGELLEKQDEYYPLMLHEGWNLEKLILFFMRKFHVKIYTFPFVMYSIRLVGGTSRWSMGDKIDETTDAYIKYIGEYDKANRYYHHWKKSQLSSDEYYSSENCVQLFEKNVGHCTRG